jgi:hypothetical protein
MCSHTVVGEQEVQEGTKHSTLRGPRVEGQRGRCVVAYPHLGATRQEVSIQLRREGFMFYTFRLLIRKTKCSSTDLFSPQHPTKEQQ